MDRRELRALVIERSAGLCEWACCPDNGEQMAHLRGVGMGGTPDGRRDQPENVSWLCRFHHDLLDGRTHAGLRREMGVLLATFIDYRANGHDHEG